MFGIFKKLKTSLSKTRNKFQENLESIFSSKKKIDEEILEDLEELLIQSDIGIDTTLKIINLVSKDLKKAKNTTDLKELLKEKTLKLIEDAQDKKKHKEEKAHKPLVIMLIGVNGTGKTTTIGKLAYKFKEEKKKVLIAAADTFRMAAIEQLEIWADKADAKIVKHKERSDPAAVCFDALDSAISKNYDILLIDTAGRLHNNDNLMQELQKIKKSLGKKLEDAPHETFLVIDATTGQNAISQVNLFNEKIGLTGIIMTKLDGTAKGGVIINIMHNLKIPLKYIGLGEKIQDLEKFDAKEFLNAFF